MSDSQGKQWWIPPPTACSGPVNRQESVREVYLTDDAKAAALLLDKAIAGCSGDLVEEIRSPGNTLASWRTEILAHHTTGASNGPTEGLNLCVKRVKRCGHGFKRFENYRLRVLLHAGGVTWPSRAVRGRLGSECALRPQTRRPVKLNRPFLRCATSEQRRESKEPQFLQRRCRPHVAERSAVRQACQCVAISGRTVRTDAQHHIPASW